MSVDLGTPGWRLVGIVDGVAALERQKTSRWIDLRTWPPKLPPVRDECVRAVGPGVVLVDGTVYQQPSYDKKRIAIGTVTTQTAVGVLDGKIAVTSPPMIFDGAWKPLAAEGGSDPVSAIVGRFVIVNGRSFVYDGALVPLDDLPRGTTSFIATDDGFIAASGKLVIVTRDGKQREDRAIGMDVTSVAHYEGRLLVGDGRRYSLYDLDKRVLEAFDLGFDAPATLIVAPCGVIALGDDNRYLLRVRV